MSVITLHKIKTDKTFINVSLCFQNLERYLHKLCVNSSSVRYKADCYIDLPLFFSKDAS